MTSRGRQAENIVSLLAWVLLICATVHGHQTAKRQISLSSVSAACIAGFFSLGDAEQQCLTELGEAISFGGSVINIELTPTQLDRACGVTGCRSGLASLIKACETEVRSGLQIPEVVDLAALLDLLCVKDTNNSYCFHELERPLLEDDHDPVVLCSSALSGGGCSTNCESVLRGYTTSCCLVTYLYLSAGNNANQIRIGTSGLWQSCGLTAPNTCQGFYMNIGPRPTPAAQGGSSTSGSSNGGIVAGGVIGGLLVIALAVLVVLLLVFLVYRYRAGRYPVGSVKFTDERVEQNMDVTLTAHEATEANLEL